MAGADFENFLNALRESHPWLPRPLREHYARVYGTRTKAIVKDARALSGLGRHFGGLLYEAEVRYLVAKEWAQTPDDILERRTKHYLHMSEAEKAAFATWFESQRFSDAA